MPFQTECDYFYEDLEVHESYTYKYCIGEQLPKERDEYASQFLLFCSTEK